MPTKIYDVTRPVSASIAVWPGDTPFSMQSKMSLAAGESVNLTTLTISSHTGTHVDAHSHYAASGASMEQMPLDTYLGPATVITVERDSGPLYPADLPDVDWHRVVRLLIHSTNSDAPLDQFPDAYVYPSPELADVMGRHGIVLFGSDAPSMDAEDSVTLPGHKALFRNNIAILENLWFRDVPDGDYELIALPLKIVGGDGSPVRAILRG